MPKSSILVAHERLVIAQAIRLVLAAQGFAATVAADGDAVARALDGDETWDGLVLDVGLRGPPVHELVAGAKAAVTPVRAVVLIASVFRRTSYKRRPQQLYGADDFVEVHQLGDQLAGKLWRLLEVDPGGLDGLVEAEALLATSQDDPRPAFERAAAAPSEIAELLVADLVLYSGDKLADAESADETHVALAPELEAAREVYRGVYGGTGGPQRPGADPISAALDALLRAPETTTNHGGART